MKKRRQFFTITELIVAMGVFGLLSMFTLRIFSGVQNAWVQASQESEVDESARVALDIITDELKNIVDLNRYDSSLDSTKANQYFVFYLPILQNDHLNNYRCPHCAGEVSTEEGQFKCKFCDYQWPGTLATGTMFAYLTKISGKIKFSGFCLAGTNVLSLLRYSYPNDDTTIEKFPFIKLESARDGTKIVIPTKKDEDDQDYKKYKKYISETESIPDHKNSVFNQLDRSVYEVTLNKTTIFAHKMTREIILENIFSLKVTAYDKWYNAFANLEQLAPSYVMIELKLFEPGIVEKYKNAVEKNNSALIENILLRNVHTYRRIIAVTTE